MDTQDTQRLGVATRIMLAYFRGYQAALAQAPTHELTYPPDWAWFEELRAGIAWCITVYEAEQQAKGESTVALRERVVTGTGSAPVRAVPSVVREAS